jgi:hypothetical protein
MTLVRTRLGFPLDAFAHPAIHGKSARMALTSSGNERARQSQVMSPLAVSSRGDAPPMVLLPGDRFKVIGIDAHLDHAEVIQVQTVRHGPLVEFVDVPVGDVSPVIVNRVAAVPGVGGTPLPDPAPVLLFDDERFPSGRSFDGCSGRGYSAVMPLAHSSTEPAGRTITYGAVDAFGHRSSVPDDSPSEAS